MKQYRTVNNLMGWLTFIIAATVYCLTIEPTASFWDCPEFITTGYKLEVGHPPGAPFFMLMANLFTQFASDLDPATQQALDHGRRLLELLKQPLYHPMSVSRQAIILYVATNGLVDDVPLDKVRSFVLDFAQEMETEHADVVDKIESTGNLSGPAVETIRAALDDVKKRVSATWQA